MSACPTCYRDLEPVDGHCPACGADREGTPARSRIAAFEDEPTNFGSTPRPARAGASSITTQGQKSPARMSQSPIQPVASYSTNHTGPAQASVPRLILHGPNGPAGEYPLGTNNVLGRSTGASVRLADREVSRKHSELDFEGGQWVVKDLGSSNGTYVNGKRIFGPTALKEGDEVLIGTSRMTFHLASLPTAAAPKP
ncbi:MAG: FHA domain-containing protein [Deltaproteobacteria bacterium]|nr:FHA domain-containing protein [Deltaproteobacteria bacterium]